MKEQDRIPVTKVQRASKFVKTGAKVGANFVKHYTKKVITGKADREELDNSNAEEIYESLSELKGSALKVAQMMSLDKNILPRAYQEKFTMSQYSAPPLSYPLVVKTFQQQLGNAPEALFESFTKKAVNAASIGQVHQATLNGKRLAVKIQYPGVADSIASDLKIVKPFAIQLMNISRAELDYYMEEVQKKLLEETDYSLELKSSKEISDSCSHIEGVDFSTYYEEFSSERILTMDWLDGMHLDKFMESNPSQEIRNMIGQRLWDFYDYQVHVLKLVHADPHPGNFLFRNDGSIGIIDFGCVKEISEDFYDRYFQLHDKEFVKDKEQLDKLLFELSFLLDSDSRHEINVFKQIFLEMIELLGAPFHSEYFDFSDDRFFNNIYELGNRISRMKEVKNSKQARGPKNALYINRTYFGLYNLLNQLGAKVNTGKSYRKEIAAA